jgi:ABC-type siderophore export system fused ATPase/permease subunit
VFGTVRVGGRPTVKRRRVGSKKSGLAFAIDIWVIWVFWRGFNRVTNNLYEEFLTARSETFSLRCYKHVLAGPHELQLRNESGDENHRGG